MSPQDIGKLMKSCPIAETLTLKSAADAYVTADSSLLNYYNHHVYRVYNQRRFFEAAQDSMITPYDAGFRPVSYSPSASLSSAMLLESGDYILLENGDILLLES